jgi:hypothetical protein
VAAILLNLLLHLALILTMPGSTGKAEFCKLHKSSLINPGMRRIARIFQRAIA